MIKLRIGRQDMREHSLEVAQSYILAEDFGTAAVRDALDLDFMELLGPGWGILIIYIRLILLEG